jgi:hypothetical protein
MIDQFPFHGFDAPIAKPVFKSGWIVVAVSVQSPLATYPARWTSKLIKTTIVLANFAPWSRYE